MTAIFLHAVVCPLVLRQILLTKECFTAFVTSKRSRSHLVSFLVCFKGVFASKVFATNLTNVWTHTQVRVDVFVEKIFAAVFSATGFAFPRFILRVVHALMDAKKS